MAELKVWDTDPNIYLFTSLTAGSSHIITATSRMETILKANKIPFKGVDTATDELAKKLFQRRASGKKLPLIVKEGYVLGGIEEIEEWNEYDELREALGMTSSFMPLPAKPSAVAPVSSPTTASTKKENVVTPNPAQNLAIRQLGAEAAKAAAAKKQAPSKISTTNPLLTEKTNTPTSATPSKSPTKADASILSPRSTPLPQTPSTASPTIPSVAKLQKPVHAPPSMHDDAAKPAVNAGPVSVAQTKDEAKAESSEEESEEDDDDEDEDEDEDEESSDKEEESSEEEDTTAEVPVKTQDQDAKDPSKAGKSVKEGEEQESSGGESSEEEETTAATPPIDTKPATDDAKAADKSKTSGKQKVSDKKSSTKKRSMAEKLALAEKKRQADKKKLAEEKKLADKRKAADKKKAAEKKKPADKKKASSTKKTDSKAKPVTKTQDQDAADASKAGESVVD